MENRNHVQTKEACKNRFIENNSDYKNLIDLLNKLNNLCAGMTIQL
jgi:hypothetical protein